VLLEHAVDGCAGDEVALCQLAETVSPLAIPQDGAAIKYKWFASDVAPFELGPPHAGANSLDDQVSLELCDRPDDDHHGQTKESTLSVDERRFDAPVDKLASVKIIYTWSLP
jgi:hypothetical protein